MLALPLKGVIDFAAERARLAKEMQKADADIARVDAKLNNPKFVERAPEEVVEEEKEKRERRSAARRRSRRRWSGSKARHNGAAVPADPRLDRGRAGTHTPCAIDRAESMGPRFAGTTTNMIDPNNRPGGPNLILTAKSANKIQFFDAATLAKTGEIDMPASTHEMIRSPDGGRSTPRSMAAAFSGKTRTPTAASR